MVDLLFYRKDVCVLIQSFSGDRIDFLMEAFLRFRDAILPEQP